MAALGGGLFLMSEVPLYRRSVEGRPAGGRTPRDGRADDERGGNSLTGLEDVRTENGSSQGQNPALDGICVPTSLDIGLPSDFFLAGGVSKDVQLEDELHEMDAQMSSEDKWFLLQ